jgi:hypothetical protein
MTYLAKRLFLDVNDKPVLIPTEHCAVYAMTCFVVS